MGGAVSYLSDGQDHHQEDFKQPAAGGWGCLLFDLIHLSTGATDCEEGLMAASRRAHASEYAPELLLPLSLSLKLTTVTFCLHMRPSILEDRPGHVFYEVTAFTPLDFGVCPPGVESLLRNVSIF